jgi:hypothetical protein
MNTSLIRGKQEDQTRQVEGCEESKLPRRDWILLPLVAVVTICLIGFSAEIIGRQLLLESKTSLNQCLLPNDPRVAGRFPTGLHREDWEGERTAISQQLWRLCGNAVWTETARILSHHGGGIVVCDGTTRNERNQAVYGALAATVAPGPPRN